MNDCDATNKAASHIERGITDWSLLDIAQAVYQREEFGSRVEPFYELLKRSASVHIDQ